MRDVADSVLDTKKLVVKDVEVVNDEPDSVIDVASGSDSDDRVSSDGEV